MSPKRFTWLIATGLWLLLVGLAAADFESDVIELVNSERAARDLHALSYSEELTVAARRHSQDMAAQDYFSHTSLDGRLFNERITAAGYEYRTCGENIAAGQPTPAAVVKGWMNSDGHRANILSPDYCDIGVGYAPAEAASYAHYWTQDFGRRAGVTACPEPAAAPPAEEESEPPDAPPAVDTPATGDADGTIGDGGGGGGGCFIDSAAAWD
ncbi:MAG: CAP domain-containing protein [Desulfobacterales bacterium]